jgi:hypothetical protein
MPCIYWLKIISFITKRQKSELTKSCEMAVSGTLQNYNLHSGWWRGDADRIPWKAKTIRSVQSTMSPRKQSHLHRCIIYN